MIGCTSLQVSTQSYIAFFTSLLPSLAAWETYNLYDRAARGEAYASFMAYLVDHATSQPSVQHFEIDGDPHQALVAPVTEVVVLKSKAADWRWDQELYAGITGAKKGLPLVEGSYPPLRWGEVKDVSDSGCYCMLVGWDSVKVPIPIYHLASHMLTRKSTGTFPCCERKAPSESYPKNQANNIPYRCQTYYFYKSTA